MITQPSSCCVERAFSLLTRILKTYGKINHDYLEALMMVNYNNKSDDKELIDTDEIFRQYAELCLKV